MKLSNPPVGINCKLGIDGTVMPDAGYEGDYMEDGPFHGACQFSYTPERGTEPAYVVAVKTQVKAAAPVTYPLSPVNNFGWFDMSWTWADPMNPAPNFLLHNTLITGPVTGDSGTEIGTIAEALSPETTQLNIDKLYFHRYRGQLADPDLTSSINNRSIPSTVTITATLYHVDWIDGNPVPSAPVSDGPVTLGVVNVGIVNGLPQDNTETFTDAEIDTLSSAVIAYSLTNLFYGSGWPLQTYYLADVHFEAV